MRAGFSFLVSQTSNNNTFTKTELKNQCVTVDPIQCVTVDPIRFEWNPLVHFELNPDPDPNLPADCESLDGANPKKLIGSFGSGSAKLKKQLNIITLTAPSSPDVVKMLVLCWLQLTEQRSELWAG